MTSRTQGHVFIHYAEKIRRNAQTHTCTVLIVPCYADQHIDQNSLVIFSAHTHMLLQNTHTYTWLQTNPHKSVKKHRRKLFIFSITYTYTVFTLPRSVLIKTLITSASHVDILMTEWVVMTVGVMTALTHYQK